MITVIDYHLNNLRSIQNTLQRLGHEVCVTSNSEIVRSAEKLILPGVGAFPDAMQKLSKLSLTKAIIEKVSSGSPILGICLGMHLLFSESDEFGSHQGLELIEGKVRRLPGGIHIPHMGWNQLDLKRSNPIIEEIEDGSFVYFVHSYYATPTDETAVITTTDYGIDFPSTVALNNVWGTQFHPEKSQVVGEYILDRFARL